MWNGASVHTWKREVVASLHPLAWQHAPVNVACSPRVADKHACVLFFALSRVCASEKHAYQRQTQRSLCAGSTTNLELTRGTGNSREGVHQRWNLKTILKRARSFAALGTTKHPQNGSPRESPKTALERVLRYCRKNGEPRGSLFFLWRSTVYPRLVRGDVNDAEALEILRTYLTELNPANKNEGCKKPDYEEAHNCLSEAADGLPSAEAVLAAVGGGFVRRYQSVLPELYVPNKRTAHSNALRKRGFVACSVPQRGHGAATIKQKDVPTELTNFAFVCNIFARRMPKHRPFFVFSRSEGAKSDVMRQLGNAIARHVYDIQPRDMSVTWNAFRQANVVHDRLFHILVKRLPVIAGHFSATQIGMTLNALGHFRIRHRLSISSLIARAKHLLETPLSVDHASTRAEEVPQELPSIGADSAFGVQNLALLLNNAARVDSVDSLLSSKDGLSILVLQAVKHTAIQLCLQGNCHEIADTFFKRKLPEAADGSYLGSTVVPGLFGNLQQMRQDDNRVDLRALSTSSTSMISFKKYSQDFTPQALGNIALGVAFVLANLCSSRSQHRSGFHDEGIRTVLQQYMSLCNRCILVLSALAVRTFPVNSFRPPATVGGAVEESPVIRVLEAAHRFQFLQALLCMWHFPGGSAMREYGIEELATLTGVMEKLTGQHAHMGAADRHVTTSKEQDQVESALRSVFIDATGTQADPVASVTIGREHCCSVYSIDIICKLEEGFSDTLWENRLIDTAADTASFCHNTQLQCEEV
ncbi:hypothetical protein TGRUB_288560 [Toxoplasma gondii RUB]|uniref:RAP domain-containing protein n=4 Tax=Toxoplasma gondii TaxID=5811 RepID=V5BEI9_TOXGV|nr:hypothetical protein TGVEG_288560 [Toxoplasma gondii VEG]KFG28900.1 hypothetical protein TGP89_288560 [Toxoplasma gondii p89]KFG62577.1 hypothetical protein TGRUB_288560 [Toxoplasma gondii RUB]KFH08814.1 hypothetical protein TGVAND_288560 [Toxoplasma gondii VAND]